MRPHLPTYFVQKQFWVPCLEWNRWHLAVTVAVEQTGVQTRKAFGSQLLWFPGFQVIHNRSLEFFFGSGELFIFRHLTGQGVVCHPDVALTTVGIDLSGIGIASGYLEK